jgi:magnesium transporter
MEKEPVQLYVYNADEISIMRGNESYFVSVFDPESDPAHMYWLNFHSMSDRESITAIAEKLCIDKLTIEDLFKGTRRPRLEEYNGYVFFSIVSALPPEGSHFALKKERISFVMGKNFLVSFQDKSSDHFPDVRERLELKKGKIRYMAPDFLLFRMLEAIIDNYMEVVDSIAVSVERMESTIVSRFMSQTLRQIEGEKRKLMELRKTVQPMKELVTQLERVESNFFCKENDHYYDDLKDACLAVLDEIDVQKSILDGMTNLYYAVQGQKMNQIMKVLTVISAVFIPLTFIVGVYGMNFKYMPELDWKYGYYFAWGTMVAVAVMMIVIFWKRGWLKKN